MTQESSLVQQQRMLKQQIQVAVTQQYSRYAEQIIRIRIEEMVEQFFTCFLANTHSVPSSDSHEYETAAMKAFKANLVDKLLKEKFSDYAPLLMDFMVKMHNEGRACEISGVVGRELPGRIDSVLSPAFMGRAAVELLTSVRGQLSTNFSAKMQTFLGANFSPIAATTTSTTATASAPVFTPISNVATNSKYYGELKGYFKSKIEDMLSELLKQVSFLDRISNAPQRREHLKTVIVLVAEELAGLFIEEVDGEFSTGGYDKMPIHAMLSVINSVLMKKGLTSACQPETRHGQIYLLSNKSVDLVLEEFLAGKVAEKIPSRVAEIKHCVTQRNNYATVVEDKSSESSDRLYHMGMPSYGTAFQRAGDLVSSVFSPST